ncbi:MAG: LacI family DNA-binding transcriptional regulator [Atopobiaceae bacterium]|nr:LacI family DNA-binding transcriptional regulator [Atopobiaceae bacterium]MCH4181400.1 LacI family DNA-binding transcriptional regulator [Atopobiaceae bacterium]MCH4215116.1 LacI family DNA-binding transcriptional regulator [Atopobiaceae bacterium]MCH4230271.1 LacI family DNA-binding transcriptional regulator [Atopobiaceae bacterium]MCH4276903.1 LacI family DNA-binding transcriptional regulator [Atopobiaceae bacterium]
MAKASVREISRRTGYSPATVSNALNHKRGVSKETAEAIIRTAQELGYQRPEKLDKVQFILARKTGQVTDEGVFHISVVDGIERQARRCGLKTTYMTLELANQAEAARQMKELCHDRSGAIVLLGTEMEESDYRMFDDATAPLVIVDGWSSRRFFDSIVISNENSAYHAVSYLIEKGHREIGYLAGTFRIRNFPLRERGWRSAMEDAGLPVNEGYRVNIGTTLDGAYEDMLAWLSTKPKLPTAFFADNDFLAVGAIRALNEYGYKVPDDISMIGFDDLNFANFANPPLTTIHVPKREIGELAVKMLIEDIRSPRGFTTATHMSTTLVERESVKSL